MQKASRVVQDGTDSGAVFSKDIGYIPRRQMHRME